MPKIKIKASSIMDSFGEVKNEQELIRVPNLLRTVMNLEIGQLINISDKNNNTIRLKVFPAYNDDIKFDNEHCYVTSEVFKLINKTDILDKPEPKPATEITLGCDPEFFLIDGCTSELLKADRFFRKNGDVGSDGALAEIRPKPSKTVEGLRNNIYYLICKTREVLPINRDIMLYGASSFTTRLKNAPEDAPPYRVSAGFHLHFGLPEILLNGSLASRNILYKLAGVLDYYVGIPSILMEQKEDFYRRTSSFVGYGKPGDFRDDRITFEYRVPGGSLLRHPKLTEGLISLGKVVVSDFVDKMKHETNNFNNIGFNDIEKVMKSRMELYGDLPGLREIFEIICSYDLSKARKEVGAIYKKLIKMGLNEGDEEYINSFFSLMNESDNISNNIEENWRNEYGSTYFRESSNAQDFNSPGGFLLEEVSF